MRIDISWYQPKKSVLSISSVEQLMGLASIVTSNGDVIPYDSFLGKTIVLTSDIDLSSIGDEWRAIGSRERPFEGTFDGSKFKLEGLKTSNALAYNGIFGATTENACIHDLIVKAEFYEAQTIGGIIAINGGNITSCKFYGTAMGYHAVGGLVGMNTGVILRSSNHANIVSKNQYAGGLVGVNQNDIGEISDSYNIGKVSGINCVGGITGHNSGTQIKNCFNKGEVVTFEGYANSECFGGITGYNNAGCPIKNCFNSATIKGGKFTGGLVGKNLGVLEGCFNEGNIQGAKSVGGISGGNFNGQFETCRNKGTVAGKSMVGGISGESQGGFIHNCINSTSVDGEQGLVGGILGYSKWGQVTNSSNDGVIRSLNDEKCGGILGEISFGKVRNCSNTGAIVGSAKVGGIVGSCVNRSTIDSCSNTGDIRGNSIVGGLMGYAYGDIKDSYNTGTVYGFDSFSNIVALNESGSIKDCYSTGRMVNISL